MLSLLCHYNRMLSLRYCAVMTDVFIRSDRVTRICWVTILRVLEKYVALFMCWCFVWFARLLFLIAKRAKKSDVSLAVFVFADTRPRMVLINIVCTLPYCFVHVFRSTITVSHNEQENYCDVIVKLAWLFARVFTVWNISVDYLKY